MSWYKVVLLSGAAAFVSSAALAAEFQNIPLRASDVAGFHGVKAPAHQQVAGKPAGAPKCGTGFGAEMHTPDGLISWNDTTGSGYNTGGAADFTCGGSAKTKIKQVWVYGWDLAFVNPDQFNVTFYQNDPAGGSDEANDARIVCAYTGLLGATGGGYAPPTLTQLTLPTKCKLKAGKKYWVEVQNNNADGPWYWEMSSTLQGTQGDWVDRHRAFGNFCTTFDNDEYLVDCLGYTYPDYMLELH
jgi:hypothetical protein